jgi:hypothetical protein
MLATKEVQVFLSTLYIAATAKVLLSIAYTSNHKNLITSDPWRLALIAGVTALSQNVRHKVDISG